MASEQNKDHTLTFHNKISPNFREIHVDGAYGGITPKGFINLNFFAERFPIPKSSDFKISIGEQGKREAHKLSDSDDSKTGILREYEFGIYVDLNTAKQLAAFLNTKIEELEKVKATQDAASTSK
ncbi:MAG: hypothetical protein JST42_21770 [Bacteroidetes bacterium]|nr:hypothetical protein [Bacteroidota bacterium]